MKIVLFEKFYQHCFRVILCVFLVVCWSVGFSSTKHVEKLTYKQRKKIESLVKQAETSYARKELSKAITQYNEAFYINPNNPQICYRLGKLYYEANPKNLYSKVFFERCLALDPTGVEDVFYYLGLYYYTEYNFEKAKQMFEKQLLSTIDSLYLKDLNLKLKQSLTGIRLMKNPVNCIVRNLGTTVNSEYADYAPLITADGLTLLFTSRRGVPGEPKTHDNKYFEHLYTTTRDSLWLPWKTPYYADINENGKHTAAVGMSNDGQKIIIYNSHHSGDLYEAQLEGIRFSTPQKMSDSINSNHHDNSASYSYDGRTLFFTSDKLGGLGKHDIYKITQNEDGTWNSPEILDSTVNTIGDEMTVFAHPDGKTLYFSSDGHEGIGGLDIFKTVYQDGMWSKPENIGYPINTIEDDVFFTITADNRQAFYSAIRPEGLGDLDIYSIFFTGNKKPLLNTIHDVFMASSPLAERTYQWKSLGDVKSSSPSLTLFKGVVLDSETNLPLGAKITIYDNNKDSLISSLTSNSVTGKFLVALPAGRNYSLFVQHQDYLFYSQNFNLPPKISFREENKIIKLLSVNLGETIVLNNLFFATNEYQLQENSLPELNVIKQLLTDYPNLKIEITGHTDNTGTEKNNLILSEKRAESVAQWLVNHCIDNSRVLTKGYGSRKSLNNNSTEQLRQLNRRIELTIINY